MVIDDSVKTASVGLGGGWTTSLEVLPDILSVLVGITTLIYMLIQLKKEFKNGEKAKES
tara:strand:- start:13360 stop:13536 length:177 start_codon:yes stop_codon:yes gene_type:complete